MICAKHNKELVKKMTEGNAQYITFVCEDCEREFEKKMDEVFNGLRQRDLYPRNSTD